MVPDASNGCEDGGRRQEQEAGRGLVGRTAHPSREASSPAMASPHAATNIGNRSSEPRRRGQVHHTRKVRLAACRPTPHSRARSTPRYQSALPSWQPAAHTAVEHLPNTSSSLCYPMSSPDSGRSADSFDCTTTRRLTNGAVLRRMPGLLTALPTMTTTLPKRCRVSVRDGTIISSRANSRAQSCHTLLT